MSLIVSFVMKFDMMPGTFFTTLTAAKVLPPSVETAHV